MRVLRAGPTGEHTQGSGEGGRGISESVKEPSEGDIEESGDKESAMSSISFFL